jgi:predicted metal-dependent enzyme (double-stranded beta helix superfamily)
VEEAASVIRILYRPLSLGISLAGGMLAGMLFKQVWKLAAGEKDAPDATDEERGWGEVLAAAALQGAIFAVVKAAVDRGGAKGVRRLTGTWPSG